MQTFVAILLALVAASVLAQAAMAQPPHPCSAPEHRQFDFWIGQWDVFTPDGKKAGENFVERQLDGCALIEHWTGAGGVTGKSLNSWDRVERRWRQHWVDNSGGLLRLEGGLQGERMVMQAAQPHPGKAGAFVHERITWTPQADGSVRQVWERSEDAMTTWTQVFDGRYVRRR